jgi:OmpA-OmpF porin, OOP family
MSTHKKIQVGPILFIVGSVAGLFGVRYAWKNGMLGPAGVGSSSVPQLAALPDLPVLPKTTAADVARLPQPSETPATVRAPLLRSAHMAWNAQYAVPYANGGPLTTSGSLMEKHGVNLQLIRENDDSKMQNSLVLFATALAKGDPQPTAGYQFMTDMGDGSAVIVAGINTMIDKLKLGAEYHAEFIGTTGYSRGEDKLQGPAEWLQNPRAALGSLIATVVRGGDWNIVIKWANDNHLKVNPDERTWDPSAINFYNAEDFVKAGDAYISGVCETRPVVIDNKRTGDPDKRVCVTAVSSWTPVDVNVATNKGGLVKIISTKEYTSQMPSIIIGIKKWDKDNRQEVDGFLAAIYEAADQISSFPEAKKRAAVATWEVYEKEQSPDYWEKYFDGATEPDKLGVPVELGGSAIDNLQDAMSLFGLLPGTADRMRATYVTFGEYVKKMYPKLVPSYPPFEDVMNTSFIQDVARSSTSKTVAAAPVYKATEKLTKEVSDRPWSINFDTGKATISADSMAQMRELRDGLLVADSLSVVIVGHTDNTGDPAANLILSRARAEAVRTWLMGQSSVSFPAKRFVSVTGMGDTKPLPGTTDSPADRAKNRRVEIQLGT